MQTPTSNAKKTFNLRKAVDLNAPWWRRSEGFLLFVCLISKKNSPKYGFFASQRCWGCWFFGFGSHFFLWQVYLCKAFVLNKGGFFKRHLKVASNLVLNLNQTPGTFYLHQCTKSFVWL